MPQVVFIHGIGETPGPGVDEARAAWIDALAAPMPIDVDEWLRANSAMVYYQDWAWNPDRGEHVRRSERTWERRRATVSEVGDEARAAYDAVEPERVADLARVADRFSESEAVLRASHRVADQMSAFNMWQVSAFLEDLHGSRDEVLRRVADTVGSDTRVIVAHSLGSVVAYQAIHELGLTVETLVTLGSPLGVDGYILPRLRPAARFPETVDRWLNISHPNEPVALTNELAPLFPADDSTERIEDLVVPTASATPWHAIDTYLSRDEIRRVVWDAIGLP